MNKRKYFSEFGLNVYTSNRVIIPIERIEFHKEKCKYHIYGILSSPKIRYVKDSFKTAERGISFVLEREVKGQFKRFEINELVLSKSLNHTKLNLICDFPWNNLKIKLNDTNFLNFKGLNNLSELNITAHNALMYFTSETCKLEVLYIGQAFGKNGERVATDRLKSHTTFQRILTDYISFYPDKQLHVLLMEFTPLVIANFDGLNKCNSTTDEEDEAHLNKVEGSPLKYNQIINITEAAIINYFKPHYNSDFVNNFPDKDHRGYTQYYDLEYNSLIVEIDLEFGTKGNYELFTKKQRINSSFDNIKYDLFNEKDRKSMFDIFKEKSPNNL